MSQNLSNKSQSPTPMLEATLPQQMPKVRNFIASKVQDIQDVDDILQETMLRTLRSGQRRTLENPLAYAIQVAKTVIIEHWRANKVELIELTENIAGETNTLESFQLNEQRIAAFESIVSEMPKLRREVFLRRRLEGQSREEISNALNLSIDAVKKHINRALLDLSKGMEKRGW